MAESILNFILDYRFWGMAGMTVGSALSIRNSKENGLSFPAAVVSITAFIYVALLGSRALYVFIFYPELFASNLPLALAFWQDTGTWFGVPVFGPMGAFIILKLTKKPFWTHLGSFAPGLALAHAISRIGCLCEGCCYGAPTSVPWAIYSKKLGTMVHPTQVYSMIGELISFVILQLLWRKKVYRPYLFPLYGMLFSSHRFISDFFRGTDAGPVIIQGLRIFQMICICLFVGYLCINIVLRWKKRGFPAAVAIAILTFISAVLLKSAPESGPFPGQEKPQRYLIISRTVFTDTLLEWKTMLDKQGFDVVLRSWKNPPSTTEIKDWIKGEASGASGAGIYILIAGDCASEGDQPTPWHIPSTKHKIQNNKRTLEFSTDVPYGDLDEDGNPDVPVGRLTVQSSEQLKAQIAKITNYRNRKTGPEWNRAVVWMGAKGYMPVMHDISISMLKQLPEWIDLFVMRADPTLTTKWNLTDQPGVFLDQFSLPAFLSVVVSHGSFRSITLAYDEGTEIFLSVEDVPRIKSTRPSGILFLLGCSSGRFNMPPAVGPSLSEAFIEHKGGPIGVVAATGPTSPITNYFFTSVLIEQLNRRPETIGDLMIGIHRKLHKKGKQSFIELSKENPHVKAIAETVPANEKHTLEIPELLRYEALIYNLMGDPSSRLNLPIRSLPN